MISPTPTGPRPLGLGAGRKRHVPSAPSLPRTRTRRQPASRGRSRLPGRAFERARARGRCRRGRGSPRAAMVTSHTERHSSQNWRISAGPRRTVSAPSTRAAMAENHSISGWVDCSQASTSPRFQPSRLLRTASTFSCDTAYSDSPTASRAVARSKNDSRRTALPLRTVHAWWTMASTGIPLLLPRPVIFTAITTRSPISTPS